jgi:hypothetical protein
MLCLPYENRIEMCRVREKNKRYEEEGTKQSIPSAGYLRQMDKNEPTWSSVFTVWLEVTYGC